MRISLDSDWSAHFGLKVAENLILKFKNFPLAAKVWISEFMTC